MYLSSEYVRIIRAGVGYLFAGVVRTGLAVCFDVAICSLRGALQTAAVLKLNEPRLHEVESYANYIS